MLLQYFRNQPCLLLHLTFQEFDASVYDYPLYRSAILAVPINHAARRAALKVIVAAWPRANDDLNYRCHAHFLRLPSDLPVAKAEVDRHQHHYTAVTGRQSRDRSGWAYYG